MSYETIEAAVVDILQGIPGLEKRIFIADRKQLSQGHKQAVIIDYAGFRQDRDAYQALEITWVLELLLCVRYQDDAQVRDDQRDLRNTVMNRLSQYPKLNNTSGVLDALIRYGRKSEDEAGLGRLRFFTEVIVLEATENLEVTYVG